MDNRSTTFEDDEKSSLSSKKEFENFNITLNLSDEVKNLKTGSSKSNKKEDRNFLNGIIIF